MNNSEHSRGAWLPVALVGIVVLIPLATLLVSTWLLGWKLQPVRSASMEPTYPVGSMLVVEPIDASAVEPGMAITFVDPADARRLVTHRVVERAPGHALAFITQGDGNVTPDPIPVPARAVRGKVRWYLPHLGGMVGWLEWPWSFLLLVVGPTLALLASEVRGRRRVVNNGAGKPHAAPLTAA